MEDIRLTVLKELADEYQITHQSAIFYKIIKRVDKLLISRIAKLKRQRLHLRPISTVELYNTAIIGLHKAVLKTKLSEKPDKFLAKIISYTGHEILKTYKYRPKEIICPIIFETPHVSIDLPTEMTQILVSMKKQNLLSYDELFLIKQRFVDKKTLRSLSIEKKIHYATMGRHMMRIFGKIRKYCLKRKYSCFDG